MDCFDDDNFDPIKYINEKFPDENSLQNLDTEIENLENQLGTMNEELTSSIHDHALSNIELQAEIQQSHQTTKNIIEDIKNIKDKAEKSENLVYEMCKDIKSLDTAKKNLTFSITALKKFIMMMTAVDKLREYCEHKVYKEVSHLIQAFDELALYFKKYQNIPQIQDLFKEKEAILKELKVQLKEDFEGFDKQAITLKSSDMADACSVVEAMGPNFKNEIVGRICGLILDNYTKTFETPEYNNLESYERRFTWLQRNLKEFEARWTGVFPEYWAVSNYIIYEFCGLTRISLTQILEREAQNADVKDIMTSLQLTLSFEQGITKDMEKRFAQYIQLANIGLIQDEQKKEEQLALIDPIIIQQKQEKGPFLVQRLPKFKGSISDSFETYLKPYVQQEETEMINYIQKMLNEQKDEEKVSDLNVLNSSLFMFNYIKTTIKRTSQYSRSQVLSDIAFVIKKGLQFYSNELMSLIIKEEKNKKDENQFFTQMGFIINTAEYCKDNMQGLEDAIVQNLEQPFCDNIDMNNEEESFIQTINKGIEVLLNHIGKVVDPKFNDILKGQNFGNTDNMEIQPENSACVQKIIKDLMNHVQQLKALISETYFIFYLNKLVVMINQKCIQTIYKFTKFGIGVYPQMVADCTELEICLKDLAKLDNDKKTASYDNFVTKTFDKTKNLLKLLGMPTESFMENFFKIFEDAKENDIDKLIKIKGIKKQEALILYQRIKK